VLTARPIVLVGLLGGLFSVSPPAAGAATGATVETAKALMLNGQAGQARSLLQDLARAQPSSNDIAFLLGLLAIDASDYHQAVGLFRSILVRDPTALRVRLELARAFYLSHDYENAFRQFQFARAGKLPPGVGASIDRFVAAIRREKNWSYNVSFAVAPDTNINNGTSSKEATIFGLPFDLSDDTRKRSGTGLAITASGEFAPRLSEQVRLRMGSAIERREYEGKAFDDMTIAAYAGPRLLLERWDLSVLATGFHRSVGGRSLAEGFGMRLESSRAGTRTAISLGLAAQQVRYPRYPLQNGLAYSISGGALRALTPASALNARIGASRKSARSPELASWSGWLAAGYYRDLPGGFSVYVEPSYSYSRYDAADPFFGVRRKDRLLELQLAVLNRRIVLNRFTPRIALTLARRRSTIDLFNLKQRRIEAGFTSAF
jgi:outer membrane protein